MQYRPEIYRPRYPSFDVQEQVRVQTEPKRRIVVVDRWVSESQRSYKDPTAGLKLVDTQPTNGAGDGKPLVSEEEEVVEGVDTYAAPVEPERPPFESWAMETKNAYITGAQRERPTARPAVRSSSAQPLSRTYGTRVRITEQLEREHAAMANCSPQRLLVPPREAYVASAVAARSLHPPRRAVRHSNAPARSNSGVTTRSGLTSADVARQRGPMLRRLASVSRREVACQTDSTLAELTAIAETERALFTTDLSICPSCSKVYRGPTTQRNPATNATESSYCGHCEGRVALVRLLVSAPVSGIERRQSPPPATVLATKPAPEPESRRPRSPPRSASRTTTRSRSPAFDSEGTKLCLQWCQ